MNIHNILEGFRRLSEEEQFRLLTAYQVINDQGEILQKIPDDYPIKVGMILSTGKDRLTVTAISSTGRILCECNGREDIFDHSRLYLVTPLGNQEVSQENKESNFNWKTT